ncbi:MAG: LysM peptidoglycan-binding domain-containing protein [Planctomycetota bacterium]
MAQETKVGLLIGLALILLVGLVLSDLFTTGSPESAEASSDAATEFGREAQAGIYDAPEPSQRPAIRQHDFDAMPGFAAEPARDYHTPSPTPPVESWSPPAPTKPSPSSPSLPGLTVEPPLPDLDTLEAHNDALAQFNRSFEAMRLAVQNPAEPEREVTPTPEVLTTTTTQPQTTVIEPLPVVPTTPTGGTTYIHYVQAGQTLNEIARQHYGNPEFAAAIAQTNPTKVDREGQVRAGARLEIPPLGSPVFSRLFQPVHEQHAVKVEEVIPALPDRPAGPTVDVASISVKEIEVQPGDTLSELASEHLGTSKRWRELIEANRDQLETAADLRSGMTLRLPEGSPTVVVATETKKDIPSREVTPTVPQEKTKPSTTYTVQAGDNLTRIAARELGDGERWDDLLEANRDQLENPELLQVGMVLKLPTASVRPSESTGAATKPEIRKPQTETAKTYTVQTGDNLTRIAARELGDGDRWRELFEANADQLDSPNDLFAGQTLRLP